MKGHVLMYTKQIGYIYQLRCLRQIENKRTTERGLAITYTVCQLRDVDVHIIH